MKRRPIQDSRNFQDHHGPRTRGNFRAGPAHRRPVRGPRGLPRCNWQFWAEPDDTNHGPQIIVTEPSGASHYLIDLDTFGLKVRRHRDFQYGQAASYVEKSRMAARMEDMANFSSDEMDIYGDDEESALPSYTSSHATRWWLRWGRMLFRSGCQPRSLLPMYQNDTPFDLEKVQLLGYDGAQDEKPREVKVGGVRAPGVAGALRSLACCCSKS